MNQLERREAEEMVRKMSARANSADYLASYIKGRFQITPSLARQIVKEALNLADDPV